MDKPDSNTVTDVPFEYINPRYILGIIDEPNQILQPISGYAQEPLLPLEEACEPIKTIVPRLEAHVWIAKQNSKNPTDGLTHDESAAIRLYTMEWDACDVDERGSLYAHLNRTLKQIDRLKLRPWFRYLKLLLTGLAKLPPAPRQTVWRGVRKDYSADYPPGAESTWWAFSSCTTSLSVLESDLYLGQIGTRTLFSIETFSGRTIRGHSHFQVEDEILLLPGTFFEVKSRLNPAPDLFIVHLTQKRPPHDLLEPPFEGAELIPPADNRTDMRTICIMGNNLTSGKDNRCWYEKKKMRLGYAAIVIVAIILTIVLAVVFGTRSKRDLPIAITSTTTAVTFSRHFLIPDPVSIANAFYAFDNNTFDLYGRRHGKVIGGSVSYVQGYVAYGKAIVLKQDIPTKIYIQPSFHINNNTSFTIEGFFWLSVTQLNAILVQLTPAITMGLTDGKLSLSLGLEVIISGRSVISTDQWHQFSFVYDAMKQRARIFIDGSIDVTNDSVTPDILNDMNNSSIIIGEGFRGYIDQLSMILKAKSPAEIRWDATTDVYYPLDISYYHDNGPNGINGTASDVTVTSAWLKVALNFNSSKSYYRTGELTALGTPRKAFSILLWVRAEAHGGVFLTVANRYTCLLVLGLQNDTNILVAFLPNATTSGNAVNVIGPKMPAYQWVHVAITWSLESQAKLYTSGFEQASSSEASRLNNARGANNGLPMTITLGHYDGTANCQGIEGINPSDEFMGSLDELYVFSRELPCDEINEILTPPRT